MIQRSLKIENNILLGRFPLPTDPSAPEGQAISRVSLREIGSFFGSPQFLAAPG